ncbi:MAG: DUF2330 domain-containing protein [Myxococcota bacterium]|nr:DUF2330 domain-containing protein [Myxococcota bacterium]
MTMRLTTMLLTTFILSAAALVAAPNDANAFCGFYVSGGDADLFNDATQVVLMRHGTQTVLSMQNNYEGPIKQFAMVVPVPEVLMEENVKTLEPELFDKIDQLSAPRLVEYFEQDPCYKEPRDRRFCFGCAYESAGSVNDLAYATDGGGGEVSVEASFAVGEYTIEILNATEATALEEYLQENNYNIPGGATEIFNQYIAQGMYFFVAKVDPAKVTFEDGKAVLSPLRVQYNSETFQLPIRLGMVNSSGEQDLIVYLLASERYEAANYKNATIPTNVLVSTDVRSRFGDFYTTLFDKTLEENPGAVITEYSWNAGTCDPCPGPNLDTGDIQTFGGDVLDADLSPRNTVLTRLHARYSDDGVTDDIVFKTAPAIIGGRGTPTDAFGAIGEKSAQESHTNNFQGRYIMLNEWTGDVKCKNPNYGVWDGIGPQASAVSPNSGGVKAASGPVVLADFIREDVASIGQKSNKPFQRGDLSGGRCSTSMGHAPMQGPGALLLLALGFVGFARRKTEEQ